jgi:uncharacterized protein YidB (DUF937 family)
MSQLDGLLGGLLGGKGGGLEDMLGGLAGRRGEGSNFGGGGGAGLLGALLPLLAGFLQNGGLQKVIAGLQAQGKQAQAQSWISTGENQAVSGADLESAMGHEEIARIAAKLGLSEEETADALAEVLPRVVDTVSPQGELPAEDELDDLFAQVARADS